MKASQFILIFIVVITTLSSITQVAEAQVRRRARVARHTVRVAHRVRHRVVVRRAHIRYASLPRWGTAIAVVPAAAVIVRAHSHVYHYHDGIFYAPHNNSFVVVRPMAGIRVRVLPVGFRTLVVAKRNYYYYYGTFYTKVDNADEYEVAEAPEGAIVDALPDGYEVKKVGDTEYYVLDGVYYAEVETDEVPDGIGYEVVKMKT